MDALTVSAERPDTLDVAALLTRHFELMRSNSPAESCHVMDVSELLEAEVTLLAARREGQVLGIGAIKTIEPGQGELKSMHTAEEARGQGVAQAILDGLTQVAQEKGLTRISLETGTAAMFAPARSFYAANGFTECPPFGAYRLDPLSVFMTRLL